MVASCCPECWGPIRSGSATCPACGAAVAGTAKAWFFGTEPPTPVKTWGPGGLNRKAVLGAGAGVLALIIGSGIVYDVAGGGSSDGSFAAGSQTMPEPGGNGYGYGQDPSADTASAAASPSYVFTDDFASPTTTVGPYTGNAALPGIWEGENVCGPGEIGMELEISASAGGYVTGYWGAWEVSGGAQISSAGLGMIGLSQGPYLAVHGTEFTMGDFQPGYFEGTLSSDGTELTGPMSGCGGGTVTLQKGRLETGADDPLPGTWTDSKGEKWTFTSTGPGTYTGTQAAVSSCAYTYTFKLTGYNGHYTGSATPSSKSGCTIPIFTDTATLDISSGDQSAAIDFDDQTTVIVTKTAGPPPSASASPSGLAAASPDASGTPDSSASAAASPSASAS